MNRRAATGLLWAALLSPAWAQVLPGKRFTPVTDAVGGLLVNSTVSADGMAFFLNFLNVWRDKPGSESYTLEIAERASKRLGNQVWVSSGQKRLFFSALPFQRDRIRLLSEQAADTSYSALIALALPFTGAADPDVAEDEW